MHFEWKNSYEFENDEINRQHKQLFLLANDLVNSSSNDELVKLIMDLYVHAREHFRYEEDLMRKAGFPACAQHVSMHDKMLSLLVSKSEAIQTAALGKNMVKEFMGDWTRHIACADQDFSKYVGVQ